MIQTLLVALVTFAAAVGPAAAGCRKDCRGLESSSAATRRECTRDCKRLRRARKRLCRGLEKSLRRSCRKHVSGCAVECMALFPGADARADREHCQFVCAECSRAGTGKCIDGTGPERFVRCCGGEGQPACCFGSCCEGTCCGDLGECCAAGERCELGGCVAPPLDCSPMEISGTSVYTETITGDAVGGGRRDRESTIVWCGDQTASGECVPTCKLVQSDTFADGTVLRRESSCDPVHEAFAGAIPTCTSDGSLCQPGLGGCSEMLRNRATNAVIGTRTWQCSNCITTDPACFEGWACQQDAQGDWFACGPLRPSELSSCPSTS